MFHFYINNDCLEFLFYKNNTSYFNNRGTKYYSNASYSIVISMPSMHPLTLRTHHMLVFKDISNAIFSLMLLTVTLVMLVKI